MHQEVFSALKLVIYYRIPSGCNKNMVWPIRTVGKKHVADQNMVRPISIAASPVQLEARTAAAEKYI